MHPCEEKKDGYKELLTLHRKYFVPESAITLKTSLWFIFYFVSTDYLLFAEMLTQRPLNLKARRGQHMTQMLSKQGEAYMKDMSEKHFDSIMEVLRQLPRSMLLIIR